MKKLNKADLLGLIFTTAGVVDAGYLSWIKITGTEARCLPGLGNCGTVNNSAYSLLYGVPVAYLGLMTYLILFGMIIFWLKRGENSITIYGFFGVSLVGFLFSGYLTYVEVGILHAICFFCVLSAIFMTVIFGLSLYKISKLLNN
jgi:uncharacterized membrane protein